MSLSLSSVHCCGELHTISASVCCCPGNRDSKNRSIFFTPDISGAQSYCFYWHYTFSHLVSWPLYCICTCIVVSRWCIIISNFCDFTCAGPQSHFRCCFLCLPMLSWGCTWWPPASESSSPLLEPPQRKHPWNIHAHMRQEWKNTWEGGGKWTRLESKIKTLSSQAETHDTLKSLHCKGLFLVKLHRN